MVVSSKTIRPPENSIAVDMSFPERSDNFAEEEFNDIWFDASEESWFDTSEYYIEEDYEVKVGAP